MTHAPNPVIALSSGWATTWPAALLAVIWGTWLLSWVIGAFFSGRTEKHITTWESRTYRIPIVVGAILLTPWTAIFEATVEGNACPQPRAVASPSEDCLNLDVQVPANRGADRATDR